MLTKEQFASLKRDFIVSQDFVQIAHDVDRTVNFVCHHNAYLVAGFLKGLGHDCRWLSGYYRCNPPAPPVRHSWIEVNADGKPAVILEFDPRQLFDRGDYEKDLMPSGEIPELKMRITPIAMIVAPGLVELPDDADELRFIVPSQEVFNRYVQNRTLTPDIDFERLDELAKESQAYYADFLEDFGDSEED